MFFINISSSICHCNKSEWNPAVHKTKRVAQLTEIILTGFESYKWPLLLSDSGWLEFKTVLFCIIFLANPAEYMLLLFSPVKR